MQGSEAKDHILSTFKRLVVVGASATPGKPAHDVPEFMLRRGFDVVPVNPNATEVLGRKSHPTVGDVPRDEPFAVVVFRPSTETPQVARDAVAAGARGLWLQSGIAHADARRVAEEAGVPYVEDACIMIEFQRMQRKR